MRINRRCGIGRRRRPRRWKLVGRRWKVVGMRPSAVVGKVRRQAEMAAPPGLAA
jgi:hypothetical protein